MAFDLKNIYNDIIEQNNNNNNKICEMNNKKCSKVSAIPEPINLDSKENFDRFLSNFDYMLCDCDGILWTNNDVIPDVPKVLNEMRRRGKKIIFATNNSTKTREQMLSKLTELGYEATIDEMFPTSYTTAVYLKAINFDRKVFIVGSSGIAEELEKVGIQSIGTGPDPTPKHWSPGYATFELNPEIGAVVIGFDNQISYPKLVKACSYAIRPDCLFIAANADEAYPSPDADTIVPGPGAYVAAIQVVCNKEVIPVSKPYKFYFNCIRHIHNYIDRKRCVMIGDRLTTDIVFGKNNGIKTLFVETGISTYEDMNNMRNSENPCDHICVPDYYLKSLSVLNKYL